MDKTGFAFIALLAALAAIVVSVLLVEVEPRSMTGGEGGLVDPPPAEPLE